MKEHNWYVVRVKPGSEQQFVDWLSKSIASFGEYCSEFLVPESEVRGKKGVVSKKVYPGYVFMKVLMSDVVLRQILSSPFALKFLAGAGSVKPKIVTEEEMEAVRTMMKKEVIEDSDKLSSGDEVMILDEAFKFYTGVVDYIDERSGSVKVNIVFFGKMMSITFKLHQVRKK